MNATEVASAYLNSLVYASDSHLFSLDARPLPQLSRSDFVIWLDGFSCGVHEHSCVDDNTIPAREEVFQWVELALDRFFEDEMTNQNVAPGRIKAHAAAAAAEPIVLDEAEYYARR